MSRRTPPNFDDPWDDWPATRARWAYRALACVVIAGSVFVSSAFIGFIVGKLTG